MRATTKACLGPKPRRCRELSSCLTMEYGISDRVETRNASTT